MIGQTISHYRILEELGVGGMGSVYKAEDTRLKKPVALKFLSPELTGDPEAKQRFVNEVRSVFALEHQNICNVHELDETRDGQLYLCMAYYDGQTLKDSLSDTPMSVNGVLETARQVTLGLEAAHGHGIVHRDLKPANIMITDTDEVKIVDFGIAKLKGTTRFTQTGRTLGTLFYMSPEQARGHEVDGRSDIFSLGVIMYEMLANRLPFRGEHDEAIAYQIVHEDPQPLTDHRPEVPMELVRVVDKAMRKDPEDRYATVTEFREDIERVQRHTRPHAGTGARTRRRRRMLIAVAALLALTGLGLFPSVRNGVRSLVPGGTERIRYLAVLPLENVGGDPSDQAFCDGLMETLTSKLSSLQRFHTSLWVMPASDVRKAGITSAMEARRHFGVNLVITGSLQRLDDSFRLTLNLIDVKGDRPRQLHAVVIDDRMDNVVVLQDDTVVQTAGMLNMRMDPGAQIALAQGSTEVSRAFEFYAQGRGHLMEYENEGKLDEAIRSFDRSTDEDALYALAYSGLGEAYWRKYSITMDPRFADLAVKKAERAVVLDDRLAPVHTTDGIVLRGTGRYEESVDAFLRALDIDSLHAEAYRGLAGAYSELGRTEDAEATYKKAIAMKPRFWAGYNDLARFYFEKGRYEEAIPVFERITEIAPDNIWGYNNIGACYYYLGKLDEAEQWFEASNDARPNRLAYSNLGAVYYLAGDYEKSASVLEESLKINDASYVTWMNLANAYYWIPGRRDESIGLFRRCAEMAEENRKINPQDEYILIDLASFYAMTGDEARTRELIDDALAIAGDNFSIMYQAGHAYEQLGERDAALEWLEKAVAEGYPISEIESDPFMTALTADERFQRIAQNHRQ